MFEIITYASIFLVTSFAFIKFLYSVLNFSKRLFYIKNFNNYVAVLEYHMEKAYDMIHKDKILAYSLEAYRMPDQEYETVSHDFVHLVQKLIGENLLDEYITLYGGADSFIFVILEYFGRRYEDDEIRKTALDNLTSEE